MKFFKSPTNILFLSIIFLIIAALIFCCSVIYEKDNIITNLSDEISSTQSALDEISEKMTEAEAKIKEITENNSSLKSELDDVKKENDGLKSENSKLASANAQLTANHQDKAKANELKSAANGQKICYLTFDDGPSDNTLKILEILKEYDAKATFFVMNTDKLGYIKAAHEQGHTIGLHTSSHKYDKLYASESAYFSDLKEISAKVKALIGVESNIIRFPGGSSNKISEKYSPKLMKKLIKSVQENGYFYFDWNVDSSDASGGNVSYTKIRDSVIASSVSKSSVCILMHDSQAKTSTVTALPEILKGLKKRGFVFKALTKDSYGYHHNIT